MSKNKRPRPAATTDFASLLSQHKKVKRQRKQPKSKSTSSEPVNQTLAALRRVSTTRELLVTTTTTTTTTTAAAAAAAGKEPAIETPRERQTLALCFLCVEALPHRRLWQEWVRQAEESANKGGHGLRIFVHAKFPDRLDPWSRQYLIRDDRGEIINFKPEWGKIEVTRALIKLFETALMKEDVGRMTYVSESCIPICTFNYACSELWRSDRSWVAAYDKPVNGYDTLMMNAVNTKYIPKECVRKCDTWLMLTRHHARAVLIDLPKLTGVGTIWPHFSRVKVADEIFMPTMMTVIGAIQGGGIPGGSGRRADDSERTDQVERRKTTHVDWSKGGPHPRAFEKFDKQVQDDAMSHGCIFARKFAEGTVDVEQWREVCGVTAPEGEGEHGSAEMKVEGGEGGAGGAGGGEGGSQSATTTTTTTTKIVPYVGKRNVLVIVCAGDTSLHDEERWYAADRTYDLCVVYFGNDPVVAQRFERDSDYYHAQRGPKWQLIRAILQKGYHSKYDYVWMPVSIIFFLSFVVVCCQYFAGWQVVAVFFFFIVWSDAVGANCSFGFFLLHLPLLLL